MMTSLKANMAADSHYHFYLFYKDLSVGELDAVKAMENVRFTVHLREISGSPFGQFPGVGSLPTACLMRLGLPDLLPDLDKVLYLDGDILVLEDVSALYQTDITDVLVAGVKDIGCHRKSSYTRQLSDQYINTGVMLMNLDLLRREHFVERFFEARKNAPKYWQYQDQDVINYCCGNRIRELPPRWNYIPWSLAGSSLEEINRFFNTQYADEQSIINDHAVIHIAGTYGVRPWQRSNGVYSALWTSYFLQSPLKYTDLKILTPYRYISNLQHPPSASYGITQKLPIITVKTQHDDQTGYFVERVRLFGIIPLLLIKGNSDKVHWKLFHFIPIWSVKKNCSSLE